jgi:hypothetical protein
LDSLAQSHVVGEKSIVAFHEPLDSGPLEVVQLTREDQFPLDNRANWWHENREEEAEDIKTSRKPRIPELALTERPDSDLALLLSLALDDMFFLGK